MNCPKCNEPEVRIMDSRNRLEGERGLSTQKMSGLWLSLYDS